MNVSNFFLALCQFNLGINCFQHEFYFFVGFIDSKRQFIVLTNKGVIDRVQIITNFINVN